MAPFKILSYLLLCVLLLSITGNVTAANKVLFYELKTSGDYRMNSGYSKFANELRNEGYTVYLTTEISADTLKSYDPDVLIIPNIGTPLEPKELAAISGFVIENGKGLFIAGATQTANQITPFGITVDSNILEDDTNCIRDATGQCTDKKNFVVTIFSNDPLVQSVRLGVNQIGFYGGNGIYLSGNAKPVARGSRTTYTLAGSFPPESNPPVAAAAIVGKGLVFLLSDPDMLSNQYIDKYDNTKFGINIIKWLSISPGIWENTSIQEFGLIIGELDIEKGELNKSINQLRKDRDALSVEYNKISEQLVSTMKERDSCKGAKFFGFDYTAIGMAILGLLVVAAAVIITRKSKKTEKREIEELGYEFEEKPESELDIGGGKIGDIITGGETSPKEEPIK